MFVSYLIVSGLRPWAAHTYSKFMGLSPSRKLPFKIHTSERHAKKTSFLASFDVLSINSGPRTNHIRNLA